MEKCDLMFHSLLHPLFQNGFKKTFQLPHRLVVVVTILKKGLNSSVQWLQKTYSFLISLSLFNFYLKGPPLLHLFKNKKKGCWVITAIIIQTLVTLIWSADIVF